MKKKLSAIALVFLFLSLPMIGEEHPEIVRQTRDEFFKVHFPHSDIKNLVVENIEIPSDADKATKKNLKKQNSDAKSNRKFIESLEKAINERISDDKNSNYPNKIISVKNTATGFEAAYISVYSNNFGKIKNFGEYVIDGKGNLYISITSAYGSYFYTEGPKFQELTGNKTCRIVNTSSYSCYVDGEDFSEHFKAGEKPTEWREKYNQFSSYMRELRAAAFTIVTNREKANKLN